MYELPWDRVGMTPISSYPELHAICFYESDIITLSHSHSHSHTLTHSHTHTLTHSHTHTHTHTLTHTHTHTHLCIQTIVSITPISSYPELYAICFYESDIITLSHTHTHTHTHVQTALSLACIDFKIIFFCSILRPERYINFSWVLEIRRLLHFSCCKVFSLFSDVFLFQYILQCIFIVRFILSCPFLMWMTSKALWGICIL